MSQRPGFMLYFELAPALSSLEDREAGLLFKALMAYAQYGELQPLTGLAEFAFRVVRPRIDRDDAVYREKCRKNAYNAYAGAARRRGEVPVDYEDWEGADACERMPTTTQPSADTTADTNAATAAAAADRAERTAKCPPVDYGEFSFSLSVKDRIEEWLRYKAERRETYTPTGWRNLLSQLRTGIDRYGEAAVTELIGACMAAGYRGIVFDRLEKGKRPPAIPPESDPEWMRQYIERRDRELKKKRGSI